VHPAILVVRTARLLMDIEAGHWGISPAPWRGDWLEAKLAMGGLSPALTGAGTIFVVQQVDRWGRDHFVYETARYARTVRAVPVALDDHCAAAARTKSRWNGLHSHSPYGTQRARRGFCTVQALRLPPRLVDGFGLEGSPYSRTRDSPQGAGSPVRLSGFGSGHRSRDGVGSARTAVCDDGHRLQSHNEGCQAPCEKNHELQGDCLMPSRCGARMVKPFHGGK